MGYQRSWRVSLVRGFQYQDQIRDICVDVVAGGVILHLLNWTSRLRSMADVFQNDAIRVWTWLWISESSSLWILQITGLAVAAVLFALMRQARAWEVDLVVPSLIACIEANLRFPFPLLLLAPGLSVVYYVLSLFGTDTPPPVIDLVGLSWSTRWGCTSALHLDGSILSHFGDLYNFQ